jgi:hypothetical protein
LRNKKLKGIFAYICLAIQNCTCGVGSLFEVAKTRHPKKKEKCLKYQETPDISEDGTFHSIISLL